MLKLDRLASGGVKKIVQQQKKCGFRDQWKLQFPMDTSRRPSHLPSTVDVNPPAVLLQTK